MLYLEKFNLPIAGVWQVREGVSNEKQSSRSGFINEALATKRMSISKNEWLAHGDMLKLITQTSISDFL